jgi:N-acetylneuraminic acid mutarotase
MRVSKLGLLALLSVFVVMALGCSKKKKSKPSFTDTTPPVTVANPPGGTHASAVSVTLTANELATVYYTNDGSTPTTSSHTGTGASPLSGIGISTDTVLKFFSVDLAGNEESVKTQNYVFGNGGDVTPPTTTASPPGGTYDSDITVELIASEPATIYYTTDGREPTVSDYDGSGPSPLSWIGIYTDTVLKFFAKDTAGNEESVKAEVYVIDTTTFGTWETTSVDSAPLERKEHTAVWTGTEMIVWGGGGFMSNEVYDNGGRYDPESDTWTPTSMTNVPTARYLHSAVWTGSEMIVWGGLADAPAPNDVVNTGGRYDPASDAWTATSTTGAPEPRWHHTVVWTGAEMIIWGGMNGDFEALNTGGRYNPSTNTWTPTSTTGVPQARNSHTAVWTGTEMIVWGGTTPSGNGASFDTGGRYNPSTNTWTPTSTTDAAEGRHWHTAVWTGTEMIVWGGFDNSVEII